MHLAYRCVLFYSLWDLFRRDFLASHVFLKMGTAPYKYTSIQMLETPCKKKICPALQKAFCSYGQIFVFIFLKRTYDILDISNYIIIILRLSKQQRSRTAALQQIHFIGMIKFQQAESHVVGEQEQG